MKTKLGLIFGLFAIIAIATVAAVMTSSFAAGPETVHIDGSLFLQQAETISVIVTAADATSAVQAVEAVGGQVTGDPPKAQAVAASIPANKLDALAIHPQVRSITSAGAMYAAQDTQPAARGSAAATVNTWGH
jgi:hypothetical protein